MCIRDSGAPTQNELAAHLGIGKASAGVSIRRLETGGFVKRIRDKKDTRCIRLSLTKKGEDYARWCSIDYDMFFTTMLESFSAEERGEVTRRAARADWFIASANGITRTGKIVNIDGTGNRVASMLFGPKNVALIIGKNKFAETMDECMDRIKAVACAKNAQRLGLSTPCAVAGRCTDCFSKERICSVTTIIEAKPGAISEMHLILVDEVLGY